MTRPSAAPPAPLPAEVDVVVVGAGLAGHAAALAAAERGATVCLLEKEERYGGSSVRAGGGLLFAGTALQRERGVDDDAERLREAIVAAGRGRNDPAVVGVYVDRQLAVYDWLCGHGVGFTLPPANAHVPVPRLHATPQGELTRLLHRRVLTSSGCVYRAGTAVRRLVRAPDGIVTGVLAGQGGREVAVAARRGVVLTSGGFSRARDLLRTFAPEWADAVTMGGPGNVGDGLRMAAALGAQLADMGYIEASFGASADDFRGAPPEPDGLPGPPPGEPRLLFPHAEGAIVVNRSGRRFVDESRGYKEIGRVCADQEDGLAFQIFDRSVMDRSREAPSPRDFRKALAEGAVVQAPTPAALAAALGIDPAALTATLDTYNRSVRAGSDERWGRPVGVGHPSGGPLDTAPYYGYPCRAGLTATYCGLRVDARMGVLDVFDRPIAGLFAAGEVVGGFHGAGYLTGTGLGKAAVLGYAAGIESART